MILCPGGPMPYALLFGGYKFLLFSLFENLDSNGEKRYGLFCSDIIETSSSILPLIPLTIFMLLGKDGPASLIPSALAIPPVPPRQVRKKAKKTQPPKQGISQSIQWFTPKKVRSDILQEFVLTSESSVS
jgi:hypothetical protein